MLYVAYALGAASVAAIFWRETRGAERVSRKDVLWTAVAGVLWPLSLVGFAVVWFDWRFGGGMRG